MLDEQAEGSYRSAEDELRRVCGQERPLLLAGIVRQALERGEKRSQIVEGLQARADPNGKGKCVDCRRGDASGFA